MTKGERISQFIEELQGEAPATDAMDISRHPCYIGFFRCWNEQRYYEAHDVLEHLWLTTETDDAAYFKGLIQAAGVFVHLQKHYQWPDHPKHGRRLYPAVRLFRSARALLVPFAPVRHRLDLAAFDLMLFGYAEQIVRSDYGINSWSPTNAPRVLLAG